MKKRLTGDVADRELTPVDAGIEVAKVRERNKLRPYHLSAAQLDGLNDYCARFAKRAPNPVDIGIALNSDRIDTVKKVV